MNFRILLVMFFAGVLFISCNSTKSSGTGDNVYQKWALQSIDGLTDQEVLSTKGYIDLTEAKKKDARGAAFADCNRIFFTVVKGAGNSITFQNMGSTKMMCENINVENALLNQIGKVASYETKGHILMLKDANGNVVIQATDMNWVNK